MVDLVECSDLGVWQDFWGELPHATVFHRREWLSLVAHLARARLRAFFIQQGRSKIGILPLFVTRRGPFSVVASPPPQVLTPYLGPVTDDAVQAEVFTALLRKTRELGASYVELRLGCVARHEVLGAAGLDHEERTTYVLDLTRGPDELWNDRFSSKCRGKIRKAQAAGVTIEEAKFGELIPSYYAMLSEVYARSGRNPPLTQADYLAVAEVIDRSDWVRVLAARRGDAVLAIGIFPFDRNTLFYLEGMSDRAATSWAPNNLMQWEIIQWACRAGIRRYDLVGAGTGGVARFKEAFGPEVVPYTYAYCALNPLANVARMGYARIAPAARSVQYTLRRLVRGMRRSGRGD